MGFVVMYDTITTATVPSNPPAVAGYVGGHWPTFDPLVHQFPHALHLSIAVNAWEYAHALDIEQYDATPDQAPGWIKGFFRGPGKPVLYTSASNIAALESVMSRAGYARDEYLIWSAHYDYVEHICGPNAHGPGKSCGYPQANGTQWTPNALNRNLDQSLVDIAFFGLPIIDPHHYERYPAGPIVFQHGAGPWPHLTLDERATVQEYDRLYAIKKRNAHQNWRIGLLRMHIKILRDRVWTIAKVLDPERDGRASWAVAYRGWRWQKLNDRLHGAVKL